MKVALTHVDLPNESKGGVAHQVHHLANALTERGHDITVFTFSPKFDACRYEVRQLAAPPSLRKLWPFLFAAALARVDFSPYDVIHSHGDNYFLRGRHPQMRTFHGSARDEAATAIRLPRRVYQNVIALLEDRSVAVADLNVGVSEATRMRFPAITDIVPCGVDTSRFASGLKSETPTVLFVGTKHGRKRGQWLADVFSKDVRPNIPSAQLWAVSDAPLEGANVTNFGRASLEQLTELYASAWVFCLPSTYEGFGVPYIESMASGTAVVASANPGAREVLKNGEFGLLPEDVILGETLTRLLSDSAERRRLEEIGLRRAADFSWERVAAAYENAYRKAMAKAAA